MSELTNRMRRAGLIAAFFAISCTTAWPVSQALKSGQGSQGPWWMQQTEMNKEGKLDLKAKPWWRQASELKVGQSFVVEADGPAKGQMLVRREKFSTRSEKEVEAIVWVIDDDGDRRLPNSGADKDSDCYVIDYHGDGIVDRIVDYIDNDGDNDPDEMDIRYFTKSKLNYSWFGMDLDDDSIMWSLRGYEYGGPSFFEADPYGDSMIYMNKLNPKDGTWSPISECPFAFYDTDCDGNSEMVVRVSVAPLNYDVSANPDYANTSYNLPWTRDMERMGIVNVRYSFDVDNGSSKQTPLHYEMGFNLVGARPYQFAGMTHYNAKRRPPQVTYVTPWEDLRNISNNFEARETGFSWHENFDDTTAIGYAEHKDNDYRWEGVFWIWERRFMENTGGPCQKWNVRREWTSKSTNKRELYYSDVDKRIHLFGAEEGWLQVGYFGGVGPLGEIRMFDTDGNGYFDRWEIYLGNDSSPVRVSTVRDERAQCIEFELDSLTETYTKEILPQAMAANEKLMAAMNKLQSFEAPQGLQKTMKSGSANFRRYAQDVAREMQYQNLRKHFTEQARQVLRTRKMNDLRWVKKVDLDGTRNSHTAWCLVRALTELDVAYGQGEYDKATNLIKDIARIQQTFATTRPPS